MRQNSCLEHERAEPCKNDPADKGRQNYYNNFFFFDWCLPFDNFSLASSGYLIILLLPY